MNKNLTQDQRGFTHLVVIGIAVVVIAAIGLIGWRVSSSHSSVATAVPASKSSTKSKTSATATSESGLSTAPTSSTSAAAAKPTTTTSTTAKTTTSPTTSTASSSTSSTPATSNSSSSVTATPAYVPANYTNLGTVSAASLYNVKSPPASSQQPDMTLYACIKNTGTNADVIQTLGVLAYGVPQASSPNWYVGLDLSSSSSADNVISSKTTDYHYQGHSWQNAGGASGTVNVSSPVTSDTVNPNLTDYYVWANGSYDGVIINNATSHPNVTQLAACK